MLSSIWFLRKLKAIPIMLNVFCHIANEKMEEEMVNLFTP